MIWEKKLPTIIVMLTPVFEGRVAMFNGWILLLASIITVLSYQSSESCDPLEKVLGVLASERW